MSGPFGSSQWMYSSGAGGFYPYEIEQSLRFNDNDSAYLSWTPASAGNRKTWTWSAWVKRGNLGGGTFFAAGTVITDAGFFAIEFSTDDLNITTGATQLRNSTRLLRDPSSWYHLIVSCDTTAATAANRLKVYLNGVEETAWDVNNNVAQNTDLAISDAVAHNIARRATATGPFDGYMAEVNFIDGTALDPTSFGEFKSDIWVPKAYSGSYGTNGFYLSFADSANIGDDLSGNTNDWTANNLASTDVLLDSPTQNWCVLNPLTNTGGTFTEGNLQYAGPSSWRKIQGTTGVSTGKWYWEVALTNAPNTPRASTTSYNGFGFTLADTTIKTSNPQTDSEVLLLGDNGYYRNFTGSWTDSGSTIVSGDILGCAVDLDAGTFAFKKNNVDIATGSIDSSADGKILTPQRFSYSSTYANMVANFGQDSSFAGNKTAQGNTDANGQGDFYYAPPAGYLALNTANLPAPAIDPAVDDVPVDYFNTVLYTGDADNDVTVTNTFAADFVWLKKRSGTGNHYLQDIVRGFGGSKSLSSNTTGSEGYNGGSPTTQNIVTTDTSLQLIGTDFASNSATYAAWTWKANGSGVSNTDGTITSTVSANQKAGFSVVGYTGTGADATVGHGLGVAPKMIIFKNRTDADNWPVYTSEFGYQYDIFLNLTNAIRLLDIYYQGDPTSTTFSLKNQNRVNGSGDEHIAYCFAEVEGFSKFGRYTGNGSADGTFVYCGFRPAFVMVKRTNTTSNWTILDDLREGYNVDNDPLYPNLSNAEGTADLADLLSNGVKLRSTDASVNASGGTYIFAAFAEQPVKYSLAR